MMKSYDISRLNILVVEDHLGMRTVIKQVLSAFHCTNWREASEGADAFIILREFQADLAIVDWEMSPVDGIQFTRTLRTSPESPNPFLPVIMLTGHFTKEHVVRARDAGVHEFIAKPVSAKALYSRIVSIIEKPRKFVRSPNYVGPDRHRHKKTEYQGAERREAAIPSNKSLTQDEINKVLGQG